MNGEDPIKHFKTAFQQFLKEEHLEQTFKQKQLITNWEGVMGKTIASRTSKVFFKGNVLFVKLTSAPLRQEMQSSKERLLSIIEGEIGKGEVEDVKFI